MKKLLILLLALAMVFALAACGQEKEPEAPPADAPADTPADTPPAEEGPYAGLPEVNFILAASASSENETSKKLFEILADQCAEKTGGKLVIDPVYDATLGDDSELFTACRAGNIACVSQASSAQLSFIPEVAVFDMPMLFTDLANAAEKLSELRVSFNDVYNEYGLELVALYPLGFRVMTSNVKIETPEDFANVKIRVMDNANYINFWNSLGATATVVAFSETYLALDQGLVNSQENPISVLSANSFNEVQDYVNFTNHIMFIGTIVVNKEFWDAMPAEYQELINNQMAEYVDWYVGYDAQLTEDELAKGAEFGVEANYISDEVIDFMREKAQGVWDTIAESVGQELVDTVKAAAGI